ncbi:hypothetical protein [Rasiella sp. SM2506]|uniref:hypothetical protein n=1 Tax=Rasiella sp. SM2506 TaxID=3423914 RepID=UPI003D7C1383
MKHFILCLSLLSLFSCKNLLLNTSFKIMGIYDDFAKMHIANSTSKTIVLLPTHHLGTPSYYDDLHKKMDSLSALNYFFYTEKVKADGANDTLLRKFRKFLGSPVAGDGYKHIIDSIVGKKHKIKLKKEIIDQPSYDELGVPVDQSENVDATLEELMNYYETTYGKIELAPCDFETSVLEESNCSKFKVPKDIRNDVIMDFRNNIVLKRIDVETHDKIAIIYGDAHTPGLLQGLKNRGYQIDE